MTKQIRRQYLPKYRMTSEEFSSDDLHRMVHNILKYEDNKVFYSQVLPISISISVLISFLVLR